MNREEEINKIIKEEKLNTNKISDGYHTFEELYNHRITLFIALLKILQEVDYTEWGLGDKSVWKSKKHSDGTEWTGWFIAGINDKKGEQITYHLPIAAWDYLSSIPELEKAPEWDGHTPQDVIDRLLRL